MNLNVKRYIHRCVVIGSAVAVGMTATAGPVAVETKLDSAYIVMGRMGYLTVNVITDQNAKGEFPMAHRATDEGVVGLLSDTIELRMAAATDTLDLGSGRRQVTYRFPMQCFWPGIYSIPAIEYVVGTDTARSNTPALKVIGPNVTANDTISPDMQPVDPYYNSAVEKWTDRIPDFLYDWWWAILIGLIVSGGGGWWLMRRMKRNPLKIFLPKPKPAPTPYEKAISELKILRTGKLWENGQERQYFTRLTDILREYLQGRFGINAMEMTSDQVNKAVRRDKEAAVNKDYVARVLEVADFVKFAKMRPLPDDSIGAFENALRFVEATRPVAPQPDDDKSAGAQGKEVKQ